ncbi:MAG TPA: sigma-70 family RNA polymerase sigma factor [Tepidisphaeraceae bacterium]|jgi:RNA polymerase sigma-70 factor (ECF subfamily)|nr:sigma-70 family RNA polymerase sigma factor [Tepidisphaeraceae bacterium]
MSDPADHPPASPRRFVTTRWSVVLTAGRERSANTDPAAHDALTILCQSYWFPLYAYIRRRGCNAEDAQDLTQAFFVRILEKDVLTAADPQRGRFRSFLLTTLKNFLANERERASAAKRGGGKTILPLAADFDSAERQYEREPEDTLTPERCFERQWAITLLANVLTDLEAQYAASGRTALFQSLKPCLTGDSAPGFYAGICASLGLSEGAVQVAASRLRKCYRELLREHIAQTVESAEQVEDELRDLFRAVRG